MVTHHLPPLQGAPARPPVLPARRRCARRRRRTPPSLPRLMAPHLSVAALPDVSRVEPHPNVSTLSMAPTACALAAAGAAPPQAGVPVPAITASRSPSPAFPSASGKRHKFARAPSLPLGGTQHVAPPGSLASQPVRPGREVAPPALQHTHVQESSPAPMPRGHGEPGARTPHSAPPRGLSLALLERVRRRELASRAPTQLTLATAAEELPAAKRSRTRLDALHLAEGQAAARICNRDHVEPLRRS